MHFALQQALVEVCEAAQADCKGREEQEERDDCFNIVSKSATYENHEVVGSNILNVVSVARTVAYCASELGS